MTAVSWELLALAAALISLVFLVTILLRGRGGRSK